MSRPEALEQAVHSASLFRAILLYVGKPPEGEITDNGNMK